MAHIMQYGAMECNAAQWRHHMKSIAHASTGFSLGVIALVALLALGPGSARLPLLDRDEPRFSRASVEMMERGEWVVPYFNGAYRFDKPVLTYWLQRAGYAIFGVGELGARAHSILSSLLVAFLIFRGAGGRARAPHSVWAALAWLTCLQVLWHGRGAVADMPMVLCVTAAMIFIPRLWNRNVERPSWKTPAWWAVYGSLGVGFLAKGPVALLVPAIALLLFRFGFWRKPASWSRLGAGSGLALVVALMAAWGIPALLRTHGQFWDVGMGEHVVRRGVSAFNARHFVPFFYVITQFISLFPWIVCLGLMARHLRARWDAEAAWLVSWFIAPHIIFFFYATQLPHYILPAFPAFFILLGRAWSDNAAAPEEKTLHHLPWPAFRIGLALVATVAALALMAAALWASAWPTDMPLLRGAALGMALVLGALSMMAWRREPLPSTPTFVAALVLLAAGFAITARSIRPYFPGVQARALPSLKSAPPETVCAFYRYKEPSWVFYTGRTWISLDTAEEAEAFLRGSGPRALLTSAGKCDLDDAIKARLRGEPVPVESYAEEAERLQALGQRCDRLRGVNLARQGVEELRLIWKE